VTDGQNHFRLFHGVLTATEASDHTSVPLASDAVALLEFIKEMGRPPFETISHLEARELYARGRAVLQPPPEAVATVRDLSVAGAEGELRARLYRAMTTTDQERLPALVFFHGGGWVIGNLDTHDGPCRWLANSGRCAVISVDYRLAPEHKFPAAVQDAIAATLARVPEQWRSSRSDGRPGRELRPGVRRAAGRYLKPERAL
jgi:acetyl esterase/lipase